MLSPDRNPPLRGAETRNKLIKCGRFGFLDILIEELLERIQVLFLLRNEVMNFPALLQALVLVFGIEACLSVLALAYREALGLNILFLLSCDA